MMKRRDRERQTDRQTGRQIGKDKGKGRIKHGSGGDTKLIELKALEDE